MATAEIKEQEDELEDNTKPPFLRRVRIRNYKSIAFCDVTLEPLTVLVGRNGSGKSNFLDALAFLRDAVTLGVPEAVEHRGSWKDVQCQTAELKPIEFDIEFGLENDPLMGEPYGVAYVLKYKLRIHIGDFSSPVVSLEKLSWYSEKGSWQDFFLRDGNQISGADNLKEILQDIVVPPDRCLAFFFPFSPIKGCLTNLKKMKFHNFMPNSIREQQKPTHGLYLESDGRNLASVMHTLENSDLFLYDRAKSYLSHIVEEVKDLRIEHYGSRIAIVFEMQSSLDRKVEFEADSMSDGTLRALASLIAVNQVIPPYGHPSVVGIEEPETSLHPAAMNGLVEAIHDATEDTQVLLTTHSAELLDNSFIKPANVRAVEMIHGKTVIGPIELANFEIIRRNLDTLGGLERQNHLEVDLDDRERQERLASETAEQPQ